MLENFWRSLGGGKLEGGEWERVKPSPNLLQVPVGMESTVGLPKVLTQVLTEGSCAGRNEEGQRRTGSEGTAGLRWKLGPGLLSISKCSVRACQRS